MPTKVLTAIKGMRHAGSDASPMKNSSESTTPAVAAMAPAAAVISVPMYSSRLRNRTIKAEYAGNGIWNTIATTTVIVQPTVVRAQAAVLPGRGASSSRSHTASSRHRDAVSVPALLHPNQTGRADPGHLRRRIAQPYPHGKALGDDHPVDRARDGGQSGPTAILGL